MNNLRRAAYALLAMQIIFVSAWIAANCLIVEKPLEHADAIMVLSGSAEYRDRTHEAAAAFNDGVADTVILTDDGLQGGWNRQEQRNPYFVERSKKELINLGVPENAIEVLPGTVAGTYDEAVSLVENRPEIRSVLIVTSAYHTRRALRTFERAAANSARTITFGIRYPASTLVAVRPYAWWLSVRGWKNVGAEYVKTVYYWVYY